MAEKKQDDDGFSFINEKIKQKPLNKKRLFQETCYVVGLAALFGVVASFTFNVTQPYMKDFAKKDDSVEIPQDEENSQPTQKETEQKPSADSATSEETEQKSEASEQKIVYKEKQLAVSDYQRLQRQLYNIGKEANKSIVTVQGVKDVTDWFDTSYEHSCQSSGLIVAQTETELLILTERKVITDVQKIRITFKNNDSVPAKLKKYDGNTGLAMLSVKLEKISEETKEQFAVASFANSRGCVQGQVVLAIGSPLGSNFSILHGNITSTTNKISTLDATYDVFTTNMIASKNGSGALVNLKGEIVGLVMQDYSNQEEESTLTAVSISDLKWLIEQLSNGVDIPYLGLKVSTVTDEIAGEYDIPTGVYVKSVQEGSPAMIAGLQNGDVIVKLDGEKIQDIANYEKALRQHRPEDSLTLTVKRQNGKDYSEIECLATLGILQ